jgi:hypothetical protein
LRALAQADRQPASRARRLHEYLRKQLGGDDLAATLAAVQWLAAAGEPAGARLLAALLDANTPGAVLLPRIARLTSTARLAATGDDLVGEQFLRDWRRHFDDLVASCARFARPATRVPPPGLIGVTTLRRALVGLAPRPGAPVTPGDLALLGALVRLETDAYRERVSRIAGAVDPYRAAAVARLLPILGRADAEIRDLDRLAAWLEAGDIKAAFLTPTPTMDDVMDVAERDRLLAALASRPDLKPLSGVVAAFRRRPMPPSALSGAVAGLLAVSRVVPLPGIGDLVSATALALEHAGDDGIVRVPLNASEAAVAAAVRDGVPEDERFRVRVEGGCLLASGRGWSAGAGEWPDVLPTPTTVAGQVGEAGEIGEDDEEDTGRDGPADLRKLVLGHVGSTGIILGFLRNPKVTAIPGLVAEIATRTRSARVLEVIAGDRRLTSGHANRDVPRALLESPVPIPVRTLRRFIHVKYVAKTDLRRMARDTARLRREVCDAIQEYMDSLA